MTEQVFIFHATVLSYRYIVVRIHQFTYRLIDYTHMKFKRYVKFTPIPMNHDYNVHTQTARNDAHNYGK